MNKFTLKYATEGKHWNLEDALNDKSSAVRSAAIQHPKATPEHISKDLDDKESSVRSSAIHHPKATPEHISKALDDENWYVRNAAKERLSK
jgi:hypothetical protein